MMHRKGRAFTVTEVLVVLAIIAILSAILFGTIHQTIGVARSTTCLSNMKQVSMATLLYSDDSDDRTPGETPYGLGNSHRFFTTAGWAGKIFPYAKSAAIFACPDDDSNLDLGTSLPGSLKISYAANENALPKTTSQLSGSRTVMLFEVTHCFTQLTKIDEGMNPRPADPEKVSAIGNGVKGMIIDSLKPFAYAHDDIDVLYATGRLDNSDNNILHDNFLAEPRHRAGANYALVDGHAGWAAPTAVSAGSDALSPSNPQSLTGCFAWPATHGTEWPCAEGIANTKHRFTFSSK